MTFLEILRIVEFVFTLVSSDVPELVDAVNTYTPDVMKGSNPG